MTTARRRLERTGQNPVASVLLDPDSKRLATAPARATRLSSPMDGRPYESGAETCPSDGNPTEVAEGLREAAVEAAVLQGAGVSVV